MLILIVLVNLHFTNLIEGSVLNSILQLKLNEHARECIVITVAKISTLVGTSNIKVAESEDYREHSKGETIALICLGLQKVDSHAGLEGPWRAFKD